MEGDPGTVFPVIDDYPRSAYKYLDLVYTSEAPLRSSPLDAPAGLQPNPIPEPDLAGARRIEAVLTGGAMGGMRSAILDGGTAVPPAA